MKSPLSFQRAPRESLKGLTLIELMIASGIIAVLLLASAAAMGESIDSTTMSRELTQGAMFLESVQEDLAAIPSNQLLSMNGQRIFATDPADSSTFAVDIVTFMATASLIQVRLSLRDQRTGREVAKVNTLRALV